MKAILLIRPGDFGLLEELWPDSPLFLPILGDPLIHHHANFFRSQGINTVRILLGRAESSVCVQLEKNLNEIQPDLVWSVQAWNGESPHEGQTLPQELNRQRLFIGNDELLIIRASTLFLETLVGPRSSQGFPEVASRRMLPQVLKMNGTLEEARLGAWAALGSPREFFLTQMKLLSTTIPRSTSLKGVHPKAELIPPLFFQEKLHVGPKARIGPQCLLAPGTRIEAQAKLERVILLSPVRIGKGFELQDQIIHENKILSPYHNSIMEIPSPRLLKKLNYQPR